MVRHIVMWKLNEVGKAKGVSAVVEEIQGEFDAVMGKIDGLMLAKVASNLLDEEYEMMLYTEFTDFEAAKAYQPHPLHQAIKKVVAQYSVGRVAFDAQA